MLPLLSTIYSIVYIAGTKSKIVIIPIHGTEIEFSRLLLYTFVAFVRE